MEFERGGSDAPTRERVAAAILELGPSTAAILAEKLELTPAAIRRHLDHMADEGTVEAREPRVYGTRGRGRPAKLFALTDHGRDHFDQQYDDLAVQALRFLAETGGDQAVLEFARRRVADLETTHAELMAADPDMSPSEAMAQALTRAGYAASVRTSPIGEQLCQQHCPVSHVAHEFPQLCEAETELISKVLGSHVQRLATIAHGDGVCTTCIPAPFTLAERVSGGRGQEASLREVRPDASRHAAGQSTISAERVSGGRGQEASLREVRPDASRHAAGQSTISAERVSGGRGQEASLREVRPDASRHAAGQSTISAENTAQLTSATERKSR